MATGSLFLPDLPEGFTYSPEFLNAEQERALLAQIESLPFRNFEFQGYKAKRRIVDFGIHYDFNVYRASSVGEIADFLRPLRKSATAFASVAEEDIRET